MRDFPAAHSMDTAWFGVDDAGHVALFESMEGGAVPSTVTSQEALSERVVLEVAQVPYVDERPAEEPSRAWDDVRECVEKHGVYRYEHQLTENSAPGPYTRLARPVFPLRIEALPREVRGAAVRLPGVRFAHRPLLQPMDYVACRAYSERGYVSLERQAVVALESLHWMEAVGEGLRQRGWRRLTIDAPASVQRWLADVAEGFASPEDVAACATESRAVRAVLSAEEVALLLRLAGERPEGLGDAARAMLAARGWALTR